MSILGELPLSKGRININGKISYTSQQPWVFSGTVQDNVLFNTYMNENNLNNILQATTLDQDIMVMPQGLITAVGECGMSLSGGQKARVSLARAAYTDADIILLDDPLAAVDTQVGHKIFSECITGLFKDKLVILVTHQIHLLELVDQIICLKDGYILAFGTLLEIKSQGLNIDDLLKDETKEKYFKLSNQLIHDSAYLLPLEKTDELKNKNINNVFTKTVTHENVPLLLAIASKIDMDNSSIVDPLKVEKAKKENLEAYFSGTVGCKMYWTYFTTGYPCIVILVVIILYMLTMFIYVFCDIWLSWWTQEMDKRNSTMQNFYKDDSYYLLGLVILSLGCFVFGLLAVVSLFMICIASSRVLHDQMLRSVLSCPMTFFDITPAGRILNRFSKDIGIIDDLLPITVQDLILTSCLVIFGVGLSLFKNYWCIVIIVPLLILFWIMRLSYLNVSRTIKRVEATTRSPLFDHVSNTLQGLTTIRAFKRQKWFKNNFHNKQDRHSRAFFLYISTSRWFAFRLDEVCLVFIATVTYSCLALLYYKKITPSDFGLILTYIIGFIGLTQWAVRQSTEVENHMISVERIYEYINLSSEKEISVKDNNKIMSNWPNTGKLQFENVSLYYDKGGPLILNNINININDKEKIGIVGRTGAGKTSLISVLFRLIEIPLNCGRILIDGQDISKMGLYQLRSSIAVIPQDPVLFMGNIRRNLDPFSEFDDNLLWNVLETVELKETIYRMPNKLDSSVSEGGSNLSVGQRQLICMARALLKKTKIIVIDEATANVDPRTDQLIQKTLKTTFIHCTVLTIAHRLNTIMDSDKILVMGDGQVKEFDHPHKLLIEHPQSIFAQLIHQTGPAEEIRFRKEAETNYFNKFR